MFYCFLWLYHLLSILCYWAFLLLPVLFNGAEIIFEHVSWCTYSRVSLRYLCRSISIRYTLKIMARCFPKQLFQYTILPVEYDLPQIIILFNITRIINFCQPSGIKIVSRGINCISLIKKVVEIHLFVLCYSCPVKYFFLGIFAHSFIGSFLLINKI